jgi:hypothetical protein
MLVAVELEELALMLDQVLELLDKEVQEEHHLYLVQVLPMLVVEVEET